MTISAIFILLAILLLVALYISRPFLEKAPQKATPHKEGQSSLLAERERLLSAIEELDFDHELGKVTEEEYAHRRQALLEDGASILQQLEEKGELPAEQPAQTPQATDDLEALIAARRNEIRGEREGAFCTKCGQAVQTSDKFCPHCGEELR
ncbi:MAG: hypothetical protein MAG431_01111 [Chloroflexi bacterium]|nr:hypothetical protein [Chloroflexota bacterium]